MKYVRLQKPRLILHRVHDFWILGLIIKCTTRRLHGFTSQQIPQLDTYTVFILHFSTIYRIAGRAQIHLRSLDCEFTQLNALPAAGLWAEGDIRQEIRIIFLRRSGLAIHSSVGFADVCSWFQNLQQKATKCLIEHGIARKKGSSLWPRHRADGIQAASWRGLFSIDLRRLA